VATIALDTVDAIEIAELLEFLVELLETLGVTTLAVCDPDAYNVNDLRADVARLIRSLETSPLTR